MIIVKIGCGKIYVYNYKFILKISWLKQIFLVLNDLALVTATKQGTRFVFGYLGGVEAPFLNSDSGSTFILE